MKDKPKRQVNKNLLEAAKKHYWKPGQSGNPAGRPPNKKYLSEALQELFEKSPEEAMAIIKAITGKAKRGDVPAFKELRETSEGRLPLAIDHSLQKSEALEELLLKLRGK